MSRLSAGFDCGAAPRRRLRQGITRQGTMSATSNADTLITIFGGSGFLGRHVVQALAKRQYRIRVRCAGPISAPSAAARPVGQIHAVQANVRHTASVAAAVRDSHVVINLVGILFETGRQRFDSVQAKVPRRWRRSPPSTMPG